MFTATTSGGGQTAAFPDVCKTPAAPSPLPMPFPNLSNSLSPEEKNMKAANIVDAKAKQGNQKAIAVQQSVIKQVQDVTGILTKSATQAVLVGKSVQHLTATTAHNDVNTPAGMQVAPSQTSVKVAP